GWPDRVAAGDELDGGVGDREGSTVVRGQHLDAARPETLTRSGEIGGPAFDRHHPRRQHRRGVEHLPTTGVDIQRRADSGQPIGHQPRISPWRAFLARPALEPVESPPPETSAAAASVTSSSKVRTRSIVAAGPPGGKGQFRGDRTRYGTR